MLIETLESISWVEPILGVIRDDLENPPSFTDVIMGDFVTRWADVELPKIPATSHYFSKEVGYCCQVFVCTTAFQYQKSS